MVWVGNMYVRTFLVGRHCFLVFMKRKQKITKIIRMPNGGEYLFQAKDDEEMNIWINKINTTTKYASTSSLSGKGAQGESQTMPAPDSGERES